ncbi:MAG: hypothetical protein Q8P89_03200 [bacterium]|nr:hypothetical protein [bacterium]
MSYSFKCPACNHVLKVEAATDEAAVEKFMAAGDEHMKAVHADMPAMPEDQMKEMVRTGMMKAE